MKKLILTMTVLLAMATSCFAQSFGTYGYGRTNSRTTSVRGYVRRNGTYVAPHTRTHRNSTNWDNYSTRGNRNAYTGSRGIRARDYSPEAYSYGRGRHITTGPRSGQYYRNYGSSRRTYVPKRRGYRW